MSETTPTQYGNNFYLIFDAMRRLMEGKPIVGTAMETYLGGAQAYGEKWDQFVAGNQDLLNKMYVFLAAFVEYKAYMKQYRQLYQARRDEEAEAFAQAMGLDEFFCWIWNGLNPLLEEAGGKLDALGVPQEDLW